jgi:hypothetical protein
MSKLLTSAVFCVTVVAGQSAFAQTSPAPEAALFGFRESATGVDLSPDGTTIVYIAPAPGGGSVAFTGDIASGDSKAFLNSGKGPEKLRWCSFVTDQRLICRYTAIRKNEDGILIGFSRLVAINRDGSSMQQLGQSSSFKDAGIRQNDGAIIDWMPGGGGSVLMAREYVPETGTTGTRHARSQRGLGVDRIDTVTLKSSSVEGPRAFADGYLTDGLGTVRLMAIAGVDGQMLTGKTQYLYRTLTSREWKTLTGYVRGEEFEPLTVDATSNSLYALKPLNGRMALYRIKLTEPVSEELVAANDKVDIDQVVRSANGQRVIGYSYALDKRNVVYFDPEYKTLHRPCSGRSPICRW